ncbi:LytTR family DNA-binding domain-containing protein [Zobellia galactanivorans]|uniref:Two-component system-Response regulator n=1 Tax=Zobellia galactanivorans (strain DSM 12802 / CCUG 47099 / CIP 106680 / NCIMB 13871 / Dsij) TaxID=63186 RepID=G0L0A7_ZOBGA|nr:MULTISPECIES: LytTR family DNA-binding domain-containing protein [Zobellia]MBU3027249.1 LytTR family DNA-binding domain-containing protein [Zobellia galactanivorans]MDO6807820.1 LytTR family DNA-binding domain-containing protein [Zobellia galactanivorans]OWW24731.1 DNA-binding response regulator [Zobellia sp. OII3]CAZ94226.1 Two-component system-Response regulator [Zobellia galactanivorans]
MNSVKLTCVVIDDSKTQRTAVAQLIKNHINLRFLADYKNAIEAQKHMEKNEVDLVFLDIEMPLVNGFQFIESLENRPQIILITGKAEYAMQAFDYDVTDYLLKPISQGRFNIAIKKAIQNKVVPMEKEEDFIFVNSKLKKVKLLLSDIKWVEGLGDYIKVVTDDENILILSTMKAFIDKLPEDQFLRVHKSYIINLNKVEKFNGSQVEVCGHSIPLSRHKKLALEEALMNSTVQ